MKTKDNSVSVKNPLYALFFGFVVLASGLLMSASISHAAPLTGLILASDSNGDTIGNIFTIKPDGTGKKYLTSGFGINSLASWSYKGSNIVYMSKINGTPYIYSMTSTGGNKRLLTSTTGGITSAFSPNDLKIVYSGVSTGNPEVYTMNADGSAKKQLTFKTASSTTRNGKIITWSIHASYSPDGTKIAYASTNSGRSQIWLMNADGTSPVQLTYPYASTTATSSPPNTATSSPDANVPAWSPDGTKIVFWSGYETENGNLWIMDKDGSSRKQLTFQPYNRNSDNPAWSNDGLSIIFETNRNDAAETWIMDADGANQRRLFTFPYGSGRKAWKN